jgi:hypothetical protein
MLNLPKKIKFQSIHPVFDVPKPSPASKQVPEWYRKMSGVSEKVMTIKKCVPFLDAMTSGYIISSPVDINFDGVNFANLSKVQVISMHHKEQTDNMPVPIGYSEQPYKWENFFTITTPKGYSTLFVHPTNRYDLPFLSISGIVDTDAHPIPVNFPFFMREGFKGIIPAGTPIIQAIPFKRESWESEVEDNIAPKEHPDLHKMHNPPFGFYKKHWWSRKNYS